MWGLGSRFILGRVLLAWGLLGMTPASLAQSPTPSDVDQLRAIIEKQNTVIDALHERVKALENRDTASAPPAAALPSTSSGGTEGSNASTAPPKTDGKVPLNASWNGKSGLTFESEDKKYQVYVGGRLQYDFAWFDNSEDFDIIGAFYPQYGLNNEQDGSELRRGRLHMGGKLGSRMSFRAEYDFAADSPGDDAGKVQDTYLSFDGIPRVGSIRVGHFKEPFSMEEVGTDNGTAFMELAAGRVFNPGRNVGIMASNSFLKGRMSYALGAFRETDNWPSDNDSDEDKGWQVTGRLTGTPWYADKGRRMIHLGVGGTHRNPDGLIRYRGKPEANLANNYVNTGNFRVDSVDAIGLEAAMVLGPWWAQAEYTHNQADAFEIGKVDFSGYYLQTGWIITGENRPYKTADGTFDVIVPKRPLAWGESRGWGAWELALRHSHVDLDDSIIRGGMMTDYTVGLHWYPTANSRILLDYVVSDVEHDLYEGRVNILQTRFQLHF